MAINIASEAFLVTVEPNQPAVTHWPAAAANSALNQVLYISDSNITAYATITLTITGTWLNRHIAVDPLEITTSIVKDGEDISGTVITVDPLEVTLSIEEPIAYTVRPKKNWVKWSNIGSLDFTIWKDNVAGERPMDWAGWVYAIKKLEGKAVIYGQNGVSYLSPVGTAMGMATGSRIGLQSRGAVCGNENVHFYIDALGRFCRVTAQLGVEILDYREFFSTMLPSLVMAYDELNQLIYICDGAVGYIYSVLTKSLGQGPANITGAGVRDGALYITASGDVTIEPFQICTDIYDMGNRKNKTIHSIEVGTDQLQTLYAAIDYRLNKAAAFATTPWVRVNPNGIANLPCFGVEFRFRIKLTTYEEFTPDYFRVYGVLHNYSFLDSFAKEPR